MADESVERVAHNAIHVMVDTETLGHDPVDHPLLAVAGAIFDPYGDGVPHIPQEIFGKTAHIDKDIFFAVMNIDEQWRSYGRRIDIETLSWWINNNEKAQILSSWLKARPNIRSTLAIMFDFVAWVKKLQEKGHVMMWAHGNAFDIAFLTRACQETHMKFPFHYKGLADVRTLVHAYELCYMKPYSWPEKTSLAHHPLADVLHQIKVVQDIVKAFKK